MTKMRCDVKLMKAIDVSVRRIIRVSQVKGRETFVALCSCVLVVLPGMTDRWGDVRPSPEVNWDRVTSNQEDPVAGQGFMPGDTDKEVVVTEPRAGSWSFGRAAILGLTACPIQ